jgi:cell division protein FtsL
MVYLQESTPDTSIYMIAGYTIAFAVMAVYLASLVLRWRNLNQDLQTLESLQSEQELKKQQVSRSPAAPKKKQGPVARKTGTAARKKK